MFQNTSSISQSKNKKTITLNYASVSDSVLLLSYLGLLDFCIVFFLCLFCVCLVFVLSCLVLSCLVLSFLSCRVVSCLVGYYLVLSSCVVFCLVIVL